jgi:hypothetical protein
MKRRQTIKATLSATAIIMALFASSTLYAEQSLDVSTQMDIRFVTLPDAPSFTGKGMGALSFKAENKNALIDGASIPDIVFESDQMTVIARGIPGTKPVIDWSDFPNIVFRELDLRVTAYEARRADITTETPAIIDIVLSDLTLSTKAIEVEGWEDSGYIDGESMEAQLVGTTILPDHDNADYTKWLAGEPILITLRVRMKNPYLK